MQILVVNPNSSPSMTDRLRRELELVKAAGTELTVVNPSEGPPAIESAEDEAAAIPPMLALMRQQAPQHDAVVIACFSDPGLDEARAMLTVPVVGLQQAALHVAAMLGRFTIITSRAARVPAKIAQVRRLGLSARLASIRPLEMGVLEMDAEPERACRRIAEIGRVALLDDAAAVLVLGCAGLAGHAARLQAEVGVPIIDPARVALATAEMLVRLGLARTASGR